MTECGRQSVLMLGAALLAALALMGSVVVLKLTDLTPPARVAVALIPLPFYIALFVVAVRVTRRLDELKQRIQLEALAFAVIGMLLSTFCYGMVGGPPNPRAEWTTRPVGGTPSPGQPGLGSEKQRGRGRSSPWVVGCRLSTPRCSDRCDGDTARPPETRHCCPSSVSPRIPARRSRIGSISPDPRLSGERDQQPFLGLSLPVART